MSQPDLKKLAEEILNSGYLMSIGTVDDGGVWVCDVIYIHDNDFNLYWMSDPDVRHSEAIPKNPKISGTITVSGAGEINRGIQFEGSAEKIEGPRYDLAKKHYRKRGKPEPKETDDVLGGDSWYIVRPTKIEVINEKYFGFKKQTLKL